MVITKGAVVIIKRGDMELANAIEKGVVKKSVDEATVKDLERDNKFLRKHSSAYFANEIAKARRKYRKFYHALKCPFMIRKIKEGFALIVYLFSIMVERGGGR